MSPPFSNAQYWQRDVFIEIPRFSSCFIHGVYQLFFNFQRKKMSHMWIDKVKYSKFSCNDQDYGISGSMEYDHSLKVERNVSMNTTRGFHPLYSIHYYYHGTTYKNLGVYQVSSYFSIMPSTSWSRVWKWQGRSGAEALWRRLVSEAGVPLLWENVYFVWDDTEFCELTH